MSISTVLPLGVRVELDCLWARVAVLDLAHSDRATAQAPYVGTYLANIYISGTVYKGPFPNTRCRTHFFQKVFM